ncbi:hypothetical protein T03_3455 [Trichinella britovi]|uniref:Uncharacterized protein n=1 Tax=Trichinella britovi TaxID=45882 RepID=A0A0V1CRA1_TRIBR|nr:hypothetical protein T03_3455 [Trichinella britovi]
MRGRLLKYKQQEQHEAGMNSAAKRDGANKLMNSDAPAEMVIKTSVLKKKLLVTFGCHSGCS